jgi:hypothetical protein
MATYVNNLRLKEIATGDEAGTWGTSTNTNLELIGEAFAYGTEALADSSTQTITMADATADGIRKMFVKLTGTLSQASTVTIAPDTVSKVWIIENATSGGYNTVIKQGSGATVTIPNGNVKAVATDGGGSSGIVYDLFTDVSLAGTTAMGTVNIDGGAIDAVTLGTNSAVTQAVIDNVNINGSTIGHTSDTDLMTVASGVLTVAGEVSMTTLDIGGTNITATATELNYCDGVTSNIQTQLDAGTSVGKAIAMAMIFG